MRTKDSSSTPAAKSHWLIRLVRWVFGPSVTSFQPVVYLPRPISVLRDYVVIVSLGLYRPKWGGAPFHDSISPNVESSYA